jgi:tetratricopeptide (TPR) repeat protein
MENVPTPDPESAEKPKRKRRELTAEELLTQGMNRFGAGRNAAARESFTKALELNPRLAEAWFGLGVASSNDRVQQRECFRRVLEIDPEHEKAQHWAKMIDGILGHRAEFFAPQSSSGVVTIPLSPPAASAPLTSQASHASASRPVHIRSTNIHISGQRINMPRVCVCCGGEPSTEIYFTATQTRGKHVSTRVKNMQTRGWAFPFCSYCVSHSHKAKELMIGTNFGYIAGVVLIVVALFLFASYWFLGLLLLAGAIGTFVWSSREAKRAREGIQQLLRPTCIDVQNNLVQYLGWNGTVHSFYIRSQSYAVAFMRANRNKLVNMPIDVLQTIDTY